MAENESKLIKEKIKPPDYAFSYNIEDQENLMKNAGIVGTYRDIFMAMCRYATSENDKNAQINIENFVNFVYEKGNVPGLAIKENAATQTYRLLQQLQHSDFDLISVKETDNAGRATTVILKNKGEILLTEVYRKALSLLNKNMQNVINDKSEFMDINKLASQLNVNPDYLTKHMITEVETDGLTEHALLEYRKYEKLVQLQIDEQRHIIIAPEDLKKLIHTLIEKIKTFYEDPANDNLRSLIFRGFREKNIDIKKIPEILEGESISDRFFLFFTQLFINVIKSFNKSQKGNDFQLQNVNIQNQYIAAKLLSILSMSKRKEDREQRLQNEKNENDRRLLVKKMISTSQYGTQGQLEFYPFTLSQLANFKTERVLADGQKKETTTLGELYGENGIRNMIKTENNLSQHEIPNIISFNFNDETYFIHRSRIIRIFFTAKDIEADRIINRIRNEWIKYPEKIIKPSREMSFYQDIQTKHVNQYFLVILDLVKRILAVDAPKNTYIKVLQERLFLSSDYISSMGLDNKTLTVDSSGEKLDKNKILKSFIETIFREGTFEQRPLYQILGIEHRDVYDYVMENINTGLFYGFLLSIKKIFSLLGNLFSGKKSNSAGVFENKKNSSNKKGLLNGVKDFTKKVADVGNQMFAETSAQNTGKKPNIKSKAFSGSRTAKKDEPKTKQQKRNMEIKKLKEIAPLANNKNNLQSKAEMEHKKWNTVMGDAGENLHSDVDNMIENLTKRFSIDAFAESNSDRLVDDIINNNPGLGKISNQNALRKYIYYKSLLYKLGND